MSRLYFNKPLETLTVNSFQWSSAWNPKSFHGGTGILLEGQVKKRSRHVINDSSQTKTRYFVLHVNVHRAHRRKFDSSGKEIEPNFSETGKIRVGHLHSSYKVTAKGETDLLSNSELEKLIIKSELCKVTQDVSVPGCIALWIAEEQLDKMELEDGDEVRARTKGDGPFIDSIAKLDHVSNTVSNYAGGDHVGSTWTDKVMNVKSQAADRPLPQDQIEGVDEDEWDD